MFFFFTCTGGVARQVNLHAAIFPAQRRQRVHAQQFFQFMPRVGALRNIHARAAILVQQGPGGKAAQNLV